jgi:hypothetical protein
MFFKKWSEEMLLNRRIVSAMDIGDTTLHGMNGYKDLVGLKLMDIKFEIKNKLIKFLFENNKSIEIDMSDNGFNSPEAIIIEGGTEIMVIRDIETP